MADKEFYISALIAGYVKNELSEDQRKDLELWLRESERNRRQFEELTSSQHLQALLSGYLAVDVQSMWEKLMVQVQPLPQVVRPHALGLWVKMLAASVVLLIGAAAVYLHMAGSGGRQTKSYSADLDPGRSGATLTLSNGNKISLSSAASGTLASESGTSIHKSADGQLVYEAAGRPSASLLEMNTLSTSRGETYRVLLPDGTQVWLNAQTSISYPVRFTPGKERVVRLDGEAYFQVAKDSSSPFIVTSGLQQVRVLGTHFNISAYRDEPSIKTTLLEGSIQVRVLAAAGGRGSAQGRILKPGEQSVVSGGNIAVGQADTDDAAAWKDGLFVFDGEKLEDILKEISRWYDVEVEYLDQSIRQKRFSGSVSRFAKASQVLKKLEQVETVRLSIQDGKIIADKR